MRSIIALSTLVAALALGAPAALATTAENTDNGIFVQVALPDQVSAGSLFTISETIANRTPRPRFVWVTQELQGPDGIRARLSYPLFLPASASRSFSVAFTLPAVAPKGTYSLTLRANTASATATTVVG